MPISLILIIGVVGGLVITVLLKLFFNKITGKNGTDFADFGEFCLMWIISSIIVIVILSVISIESCVSHLS